VLKPHYSRALAAVPGRLHFSAHSHHLWPDVTREAMLAYWDDSARDADLKWGRIFGEVVPRAQRHVARLLGLSRAQDVAFGPNTHELVWRALSSLKRRPLRVLTTDAEFLSFARQLARLEEEGEAVATRVPLLPYASFDARFAEAAGRGGFDLVYLSHVFFESGFVVEGLAGIVQAVRDPETLVIVDGYHAFAALPVDLRPIEARAFYTAGGYKYAQSGENVGVLHVPPGAAARPPQTGWFASFGTLEDGSRQGVGYGASGQRFWGATYDPTGLYRFNAVWDLMESLGVTPVEIHAHARALEERFLAGLERAAPRALSAGALVTPRDLARQGHFLAFECADARGVGQRLREQQVSVDVRGTRVRVGFGLYHDAADVDALVERIARL
jgi:selenocysteine lyase/cysteine desulfurase